MGNTIIHVNISLSVLCLGINNEELEKLATLFKENEVLNYINIESYDFLYIKLRELEIKGVLISSTNNTFTSNWIIQRVTF